jgi:hypothetical protein
MTHRLIRQQPPDGDHDEQHQLLDRQTEDQLPTGRKTGAVAPVITQDPDDIPDRKDDHYRYYRKGQAGGTAIDPGIQDKLQRQHDQQAAGHQQ